MADTIISLKDVRLSLVGNTGSVDILRGITLEVAKGETVGLVGPSGSGKSSLLMLLGGLERASSGLVRVAGQDLKTMDEDAWPGSVEGIWVLFFNLSTLSRP